MKCPVCEKNEERSRVLPLGSSITQMYCPPFYDEDGVYHNHDRNITTRAYKCSNGHSWCTKGHGGCPAKDCDFLAVTKIIISKGSDA